MATARWELKISETSLVEFFSRIGFPDKEGNQERHNYA